MQPWQELQYLIGLAEAIDHATCKQFFVVFFFERFHLLQEEDTVYVFSHNSYLCQFSALHD